MAAGRRATKRTGKTKLKTRRGASEASCDVEARHSIVDLGATRICDKYGAEHDRTLIGLMDPSLRTVYVARRARDRVRRLFRAREHAGDTWLIPASGTRLPYRVKAIDELDTSRPIRTTDVFAISGHYCVMYRKGTCINFYYDDGRFAYSWKATEDVGLCTPQSGECQELVQANQVLLYPGKNCTGRAIRQNVDWDFCVPA